MDIGEIRSNLDAWSTFSPKMGDTSKSKDLFLKVHDGKLSFETRAELPKGMQWLRSKKDYSFDKNIQSLRILLDDAFKRVGELKPEEKAKLQELQAVHNNLLERYERKNVPGMIGRALIFLGIKDYSKKIQEAVDKQKCTYDWNPPVHKKAPVKPETPTEIAKSGIRSMLDDEIAAFAKEAGIRYKALFNRKTGEAETIARKLQALAAFQATITPANVAEKLEKFHQLFDVAALPALFQPTDKKERLEINEKAKELRRNLLPALESYRKLVHTDPVEFNLQAPLMARLSKELNKLTQFEAMAEDSDCTTAAMQAAFDRVHQAIGAIIEEGKASESDYDAEVAVIVGGAPREAPLAAAVESIDDDDEVDAAEQARDLLAEPSLSFFQIQESLQGLERKAVELELIRKGKDLPAHPDMQQVKEEVAALLEELKKLEGEELSEEFLQRYNETDALFCAIELDTK